MCKGTEVAHAARELTAAREAVAVDESRSHDVLKAASAYIAGAGAISSWSVRFA